MLVLVDVLEEHTEERIRQPARNSGIREVTMDDKYCHPGEDDAEA